MSPPGRCKSPIANTFTPSPRYIPDGSDFLVLFFIVGFLALLLFQGDLLADLLGHILWKRLELGGKLEFATDHQEYFEEVCAGFAEDPRFVRTFPMARPKEVWTEFETMFREQGLPIYSACWKSVPADDAPLAPLTIPPEREPREGIVRRSARD